MPGIWRGNYTDMLQHYSIDAKNRSTNATMTTRSSWGGGSAWMRLLLVVLLPFVQIAVTSASGRRNFHIYWNTSNPIFRIDRTDNVVDVNVNLNSTSASSQEYDQVNLICPVYPKGTSVDDIEKFIIYSVSKEEYDSCRITQKDPRMIAVCNKPFKFLYFTVTFRPYSPQPGGLEFQAGHDYYFISTSSRNDLNRRSGGFCETTNMKMIFKVCCQQQQRPTVLHPQHPNIQNTVMPPQWRVVVPPYTPYFYPDHPYRTTESSTPLTSSTAVVVPPTTRPIHPTKRSDTYNSKHPNEVVKSEELTLGGSTSGGTAALKTVQCCSVMWYSVAATLGVVHLLLHHHNPIQVMTIR